MGVWFEEGGYLPSESEEEAEESSEAARAGTGITEPENPELSRTEGSELLPAQAPPARLTRFSVSTEDHEEGELEWKKPDLKGWDPRPELVLYSGTRRGLGGHGAKVVGDSALDTAILLHSEDQRKRRAEAEVFHGPPVEPGYRQRRTCKPDLDLPKDPKTTVEEKRERDRRRTELLQLKYDHGLKRWVFPTGRVATSQEVQKHFTLQEEEYGKPTGLGGRQYKEISGNRHVRAVIASRSSKTPS